jgi:hypothetical protein
MINLQSELIPGIPAIIKELEREMKDVEKEYLSEFADRLPDEIQRVIFASNPSGKPARGGGRHSAQGQPPAIITKELVNSPRAQVVGDDAVELALAGHAFYLDPLFDGEPGGGYLDRPFIEKAVERTMQAL